MLYLLVSTLAHEARNDRDDIWYNYNLMQIDAGILRRLGGQRLGFRFKRKELEQSAPSRFLHAPGVWLPLWVKVWLYHTRCSVTAMAPPKPCTKSEGGAPIVG